MHWINSVNTVQNNNTEERPVSHGVCLVLCWFRNWVSNSGNNSWQQFSEHVPSRVARSTRKHKRLCWRPLCCCLASLQRSSTAPWTPTGGWATSLQISVFTSSPSSSPTRSYSSSAQKTPWVQAGPNLLHLSPFFYIHQRVLCVPHFSRPW